VVAVDVIKLYSGVAGTGVVATEDVIADMVVVAIVVGMVVDGFNWTHW